MQLAQAPHQARAPPVPPRPSRQIVAEALKKSPPPCPTRQAPAPPINQRPWKNHADKTTTAADRVDASCNNGNSNAGGRTLVYDSTSSRIRSNGGRVDEKKQQQQHSDRIDDTSKRKGGEKEIESNKKDKDNNNNKDAEQDKDETDRGGDDGDPNEKDEQPPRKKSSQQPVVTFKERGATDEDSPSDAATKTTVVLVIEDAAPKNGNGSSSSPEPENIQTQDWLEAGIRYTSTKITLPAANENPRRQHQHQHHHRAVTLNGLDGYYDCCCSSSTHSAEFADLDFSRIIARINMSSLPGLPPLPRSLSGFGLDNGGLEPGRSPPPLPPARVPSRGSGSSGNRLVKTPSSTSSQGSRPSPQGGRQLTTLDTQLSILRREMFGLRQLDLSLLSQLWSLNESIQEFRQLLQDQEDRAPSPSPSSDDGDDSISLSFTHQLASAIHQQQQQQQQQPPPPPRRPAPAAPVHQQHQYHHQQQQQQPQPQQQHHYRSARSRNSISSLGHNLANSDDSPSSEEYGAV